MRAFLQSEYINSVDVPVLTLKSRILHAETKSAGKKICSLNAENAWTSDWQSQSILHSTQNFLNTPVLICLTTKP